MANLFPAPAIFDIPLSKRGDLSVDFIYKPMLVDANGLPLNNPPQYAIANYPAGATVQLFIDATATTFSAAAIANAVADPKVDIIVTGADAVIVADATITAHHAEVLVDRIIINEVPKGKFYSAVINYVNGLNKVMCNGVVVRSEGKPLQ